MVLPWGKNFPSINYLDHLISINVNFTVKIPTVFKKSAKENVNSSDLEKKTPKTQLVHDDVILGIVHVNNVALSTHTVRETCIAGRTFLFVVHNYTFCGLYFYKKLIIS